MTGDALPADWDHVAPNEFYFDADQLTFPLYLRPRKPGDRFQPLGLNGSKKVKDLLISAKIPRHERWSYPLLVDGNDRILGVYGSTPGGAGEDYRREPTGALSKIPAGSVELSKRNGYGII